MARWALISGESGEENAAFAMEVIERLKMDGIRIAGFVQHKSRNERGEKRYHLERLLTGEQAILAVDGVAAKGPSQEFFCSMAFHNDAFNAANRWVKEDAAGAGLLLLDGISKLEVSGKGHSATLERALRLRRPVVLICVRASQLSYVIERFALPDDKMVAALELPADESAFEAFVGELREGCRARGPKR
jgi:nucleoside-triphosphatase THEP1